MKDHGPGIDAENHSRLFQRFERISTRSGQVGLGLGLYIVHQITEAHGGTVEVKSAKGEGAEFIVKLPLRGDTGLSEHPSAEYVSKI